MAAGGRRRTSSRRMRPGGKMAGATGGGLMKPCSGIPDGIRNLVMPGAAESAVKPTSTNSTEEPWIYIRGCRIERAGLRFNSQGDEYVPDSEDEDEALQVSANGPLGIDLPPSMAAHGAAGVDLAPAVGADGAAGVDLAPAVGADGATDVDLAPPAMAADGAAGVDLAPAVVADEAASVEMTPELAARLAKKVLGEDLHPKVAALLAEVLSKMDPFYHECFIDMYKLLN